MNEKWKLLYRKMQAYTPGLTDFAYKKWAARGSAGVTCLPAYDLIPFVEKNRKKIQNPSDYESVFSKPKRDDFDINHLDIAVMVPVPLKGSGGHRNIYRIVKYLHEFGHKITVYYTQTAENATRVKNKVSNWYYDMSDIPFICYDGHLACHDAAIAAWWEIAYMLQDNIDQVKFPFSLVQDFEAAFYPVNSNYILCENSYQMGFSNICSGKWCSDFLTKKYAADAEAFQFPVDTSIYNTDMPRGKKNKNILFFAKPEMNRRCFELGLMMLKELNRMRPDIEIIMFGSNHLNEKMVPFQATIVRMLPTLQDLAALYRNADLGIVFSTTNPSLVPYEMLSCECPVADLDMECALSKYGNSEENVFLCNPAPKIFAKQVCAILDNPTELRKRAQSGRKWVAEDFPSEKEAVLLVEKMIKNKITHGTVKLDGM